MARLVQCAVEVVDPGVVRALDAGDAAALLFQERGAAVPADVEEGADGVVGVADDDQVFAAELGQEILAGQLDLLFPPDEDPALGEPLLELVVRISGSW